MHVGPMISAAEMCCVVRMPPARHHGRFPGVAELRHRTTTLPPPEKCACDVWHDHRCHRQGRGQHAAPHLRAPTAISFSVEMNPHGQRCGGR